MAKARKTYIFRKGDVIDVEEYHDGKYGAPGKRRVKRSEPTEEQMIIINAQQKAKRCRHRLLQYFDTGDCFATWTYTVGNRPRDIKTAKAHFSKAMRYVRRQYKKRNRELFWIRNIERGTKGAWHIHLVVNEIGDTLSILEAAWEHGTTWGSAIKKNDKVYDEDFTRLASYMTKSQNTREVKKDGTLAKQKIKESSYSVSRNMPLPEPRKKKIVRWSKEVKPKKGYYIARIHEGISPLGFEYRRYTMIRLNRRI